MRSELAVTAGKRQRDFLVLGFKDGLIPHILESQNPALSLNVHRWLNSFTAFRHLKARSDSDMVILCELEWLINENFLFVHNVRNDQTLSKLPLIAISASNIGDLEFETAKQMGIDDIYRTPVYWHEINDRASTLFKYKSHLGEEKHYSAEPKTVEISKIKRTFDIICSIIIMLLAFPFFLTVALAIFLESGFPIIYASQRVGTGYKVFKFLKFRSMYKDADERLKQILHLNKYQNTNDGPSFIKLENDPRITKVGKFIRKTSLDEMPQLINVLKGDMSLVGNRPLPLYEAQQLTTDEWADRFLGPSGVTGLWQVAKGGKENLSAKERIALDINYAKNHSMKMDLSILLKTLPAMIQKGE